MGTQTYGQNRSSLNGSAQSHNGKAKLKSQAELNGSIPPVGVARSIRNVVGDVVSLSELQLKLFKRDTTEAVQRTYFGIGIAVVGSLILLSCLPVGMMAVAHLVHQIFEMSLGVSFAVVLMLGGLIGSVTTYLGFRKLRNVGNVYHRSQEELIQNVEWLKSSLKR